MPSVSPDWSFPKLPRRGIFHVIGSTGPSAGVGGSAPWLAAPHRVGKGKTKNSALCSWNGKMKQFLSVIVPFKLVFVYSRRKNGSEVFQRSSIQKVISWLSRGFTAKVFQDAGSLPNHSALLAANTESAGHSDMAAHCEGSSRAIQRLSFEGSTTTTLGLFKASGLEEDTRDRGRRDTPNLTCLHACLRSEMSPKTSVLEALSPAQHCSQVGLWRSDRILQAPTSSMD